MPTIVELPDKTELEFPDGMSQGDMQSAILKSFPQFGEENDPDVAAVKHAQAVAKEMQRPEAMARSAAPLVPLPEWRDTGTGGVAKRTAQQIYEPVKQAAEFIESRQGLGIGAAAMAAPEVVGPAIAATAIPSAVREELEMKRALFSGQLPEAAGHATKGALAATMVLGGLSPFRPKPGVRPSGERPPVIPLPEATREAIKTLSEPIPEPPAMAEEPKPAPATPEQSPETQAPTAATVSEAKPPGVAPGLVAWTKEGEIRRNPNGYFEHIENGKIVNTDRDFDSLMRTWGESNAGYSQRIVETSPGKFELFLKDPGEAQSVRELVPYDAQAKPKLALQERSPAAPAEPTPEPSARKPRKGVERPWDIIDEISQSVGKIRNKKGARPGTEGYYSDAYEQAKTGSARELFSQAGQSPDEVLDTLRRSGFMSENATVDDLWDAINKAKASRTAIFRGETPEAKADKFQEALKKQGAKRESQTISVGDLAIGEKFRVGGEDFEVVSIDPDTGEVTVKDGRKFGAQTIPDGADVSIEKGSLEQKPPSTEFVPEEKPTPAPKLRPGEKGTGDLLQNVEQPFNLVGEKIEFVPPKSETTQFGEETFTQNELFQIQKVVEDVDPVKSANVAQELYGGPKKASQVIRRQLSMMDADPKVKKDFGKEQRARLKEVLNLLEQRSNEPVPGPGISAGPGAAAAGEPGSYKPISQLADQMATSPVKNLKEAVGVGERLSDAWAQGKDVLTRSLGKLQIIPGALKRAWEGVREFNQVEDRVKSLDWALQQSSGLSKRAGETMRKAIPASQIREGMAIWIDAGGDEAAIRNALSSLPAGTKPRVRRALEAALSLPKEVKDHATNLADYYGRRAQEGQTEGVLNGVLENYFTHIWKKPANMPDSVKAALNSGRVDEYFRYAQRRKIPTFLEGILQGREPVLDPADVIPHYNYLMDRAIASRRFIKQLEDATMPDGKPVLGPWGTRATIGDPGEQAILIKIRGRPEDYNGYRQIDHPALRKWKWAATDEQGRPVFYEGTLAVHPEAYERLARMMDRSRLSPSSFVRGALRVSGEVKGAKLGLLSPFHQVHVGSHALGHWTNPFFNLPEINWEAPNTQFAIEKGGLKLAANPAEMASFAEGILSPGLVQKIPIIGPISKAYSEWLFTDYLPRLKLKTFENAMARNQAWYRKDLASGKITQDQLASRVGDAINNAYGELNQLWLGKAGRDPRLQRALRLGFLAPDFGEARLRFVGKAATRYGLEERLALGTLFATLYVGARVGNLLTHGNAEVEDWKHAFAVKAGNRWYSMRSVLGDTLHAITNFPNFIYNRLNPAYTRGLMEFFSGRDISGRKRTGGEQVLDELKQVVPIHLSGLTRDDQHVWESFLQAIGVGSQRAAPTSEVSNLAAAWKKKRGIEEKAEILSDRDSPYRKARLALEFGDREQFREATKELVHQRQLRGDRTARQSVKQAFERYYSQPFTGNSKMEPAFKASLDARQRKKYSDALIERRKLLQQFRQWY